MKLMASHWYTFNLFWFSCIAPHVYYTLWIVVITVRFLLRWSRFCSLHGLYFHKGGDSYHDIHALECVSVSYCCIDRETSLEKIASNRNLIKYSFIWRLPILHRFHPTPSMCPIVRYQFNTCVIHVSSWCYLASCSKFIHKILNCFLW